MAFKQLIAQSMQSYKDKTIMWVIEVPTENDIVYLTHTLWLMITAMMVTIEMAS